jgi:hypothetical protein
MFKFTGEIRDVASWKVAVFVDGEGEEHLFNRLLRAAL